MGYTQLKETNATQTGARSTSRPSYFNMAYSDVPTENPADPLTPIEVWPQEDPTKTFFGNRQMVTVSFAPMEPDRLDDQVGYYIEVLLNYHSPTDVLATAGFIEVSAYGPQYANIDYSSLTHFSVRGSRPINGTVSLKPTNGFKFVDGPNTVDPTFGICGGFLDQFNYYNDVVLNGQNRPDGLALDFGSDDFWWSPGGEVQGTDDLYRNHVGVIVITHRDIGDSITWPNGQQGWSAFLGDSTATFGHAPSSNTGPLWADINQVYSTFNFYGGFFSHAVPGAVFIPILGPSIDHYSMIIMRCHMDTVDRLGAQTGGGFVDEMP